MLMPPASSDGFSRRPRRPEARLRSSDDYPKSAAEAPGEPPFRKALGAICHLPVDARLVATDKAWRIRGRYVWLSVGEKANTTYSRKYPISAWLRCT
jgi:hypothetical protein